VATSHFPQNGVATLQQNKNKKKGMVATVPFCLREKTREEGDGNKAAVAFFFFLLQQTKQKEGDGSCHPLLPSKKKLEKKAMATKLLSPSSSSCYNKTKTKRRGR